MKTTGRAVALALLVAVSLTPAALADSAVFLGPDAAPPAPAASAAPCDGKSAASLMALLLVCFVAFDMALLYMLNYSDPQVQNYFYKLLCQCVAVFCAYLAQIAVFSLVQRGIVMNAVQFFTVGTVHDTKPIHEIVTFLLLMGWWLSISVLAWKGKSSKEDTHAVKSAMPDAAGFAAYDLVGLGQIAVAETILAGGAPGQFGKAVAWYLLCPFLVVGLFGVLHLVSHFLRKELVKRDRRNAALAAETARTPLAIRATDAQQATVAVAAGEEEPHWVEVAEDCEMDSAAMVVAFVLRQLVLLVCQGTTPNMAGLITCREGLEVMELFVVALVLAQVGIAFLDSYLESRVGTNLRIIDFLQSIAANAVAWCLLPLIFYIIQTTVHFPTNQRMMVASFVTPFTAIFTIIFDYLADRGAIHRNFAVKLIGCVGLTSGLAWGDALISCIESVLQDDLIGLKVLTSKFARNPNSQHYLAESIVFFTLLFVILPGWKWYMVPPASLDFSAVECHEGGADAKATILEAEKVAARGAAEKMA